MKICIETDGRGGFLVSHEQEGETSGLMMGSENPQANTPENKQPARDLNEALTMAGRMLSQESESNSMFDEGVKKSLPQRGGMMRGSM